MAQKAHKACKGEGAKSVFEGAKSVEAWGV